MTRYSNTMSEILAGIRGKNLHEAPEDKMPASPDEGSMAMDQLEFIKYAADEIMQHIQGGGEFPEWMQNKLSGTHEKMKGLHANIDHDNVEDMDEAVLAGRDYKVKDGKVHISKANFKKVSKDYKNDTKGKERMVVLDPKTQATTSMPVVFEEVELEEGKSSTGYELYHRDFSSAMQHAYDFAKKKFKITVKPEEIDNKVASGPRKPSKGKTNTYRLEGDKGAIHVQVYGMDNGKYELNMYKESVDLEEGAFGELQIVAKDLAKYAAKDKKDMDYKDFMKAAAMMKTGKVKELAKFTMDLDTEPRDKIIDMVKGAIGKSAAEKMFNVTIREEVELTEKLKVSDGLGAWIDDFMKSDAPQFKGKSDEEKKKMAIAAFTDAGGKLDEGMVDDLAKEFEKRVKKQGHSSRTQDRERMAVLGMAKKKGASPADMKKLDAAIVSIINKLNEETITELREPYAVVDTANGNEVVGTASDEKGAKSIITTSELPPMKIKDKKTLKIVKVKKKQMIGRPLKEEEEPQKPDTAKAVDQGREDKKKTRIAQLQLQIAKAQETINKLNAQEKPSE